MAGAFDFGHVDFDLNSVGGGTPREQLPFRILFMGDFGSGAAATGQEVAFAQRRIHQVDRDELDALVARLAPRAEVDVDGLAVVVEPRQMDDFDPDGLESRVPALRNLRALRRRLDEPGAVEEVMRALHGSAAATRAEPPVGASAAPAPDAGRDLLAQMLAEPVAGPGGSGWNLDVAISDVVRRFVLPTPDARVAACGNDVDAARASLLRAILHAPAFRAMEATWRGLALACAGIATSEMLRLEAVHVTSDELAADVAASAELATSGLFGLLRRGAESGEAPWSLIVHAAEHPCTRAGAETLGRLGRIARAFGAVLFASGGPSHLGVKSFEGTLDEDDWRAPPEEAAAAWEALRKSDVAPSVGLVVPRFLLRAPFGSQSSVAASFDFEEFEGTPAHDEHCWGSGAMMAGLVVAGAFESHGWEMGFDGPVQVGDLPAVVHHDGVERLQVPCAEGWMSDRTALRLAARGLLPLVSVRNANALRVGPWFSLAGGALAGRWLVNGVG